MRARERGLGLMGALLALSVLMTGMLALSQAQVRGLAAGRELLRDNRIRQLALTMAQTVLSQGVAGAQAYAGTGYEQHLSAAPCLQDGICAPAERAAVELAAFKQALQAAAGAGTQLRAAICRGDARDRPTLERSGCSSAGPLAIRIAWRAGAREERNHVLPLAP